MNKLFKRKKWLSVPDAARHLAILIEEEVTEADILQLALEDSLTLSVNFINKCHALPGELIPINDAAYEEAPGSGGIESTRDYDGYTVKVNGVESHVLLFNEGMTTLQGVFDLPMAGGERIEVLDRVQRLTDGPLVLELNNNGTYVRDTEGKFFQLHQHFEGNLFENGSTAQYLAIEDRIFTEDIVADTANHLRTLYAEQRKLLLARQEGMQSTGGYSMLQHLPMDSVLVVRTASLNQFLQSFDPAPNNVEKPLGSKERDTLLRLVIGMAIDGYGHDPKASRSNTPKELADIMVEQGMSISDDTVRKYLKLAADTVLPGKPPQA